MTFIPQRRSILIASIGTSPGVLTNAVWALAHQKNAKLSLKESLAALSAAQKALIRESLRDAYSWLNERMKNDKQRG